MSSLADLPELVGFFSYSRSDDEHSSGALSHLRARIQSELRLQLGRKFRLWQDTAAIPEGALWEDEIKRAIAESVFFIPIVTPSAVGSDHCRFEFESFLKREAALGRSNLIFPLLYIRVPALESEAQWRQHDVLKVIGTRQYLDWQRFRHRDPASPEVAEKIEHFCNNILEALHQPWVSPEEREAEARLRAQDEERRHQRETQARERAEDEGHHRQPAQRDRETEARNIQAIAPRWRRIAGGAALALALLAVAWAGLYQAAVPIWVPWKASPVSPDPAAEIAKKKAAEDAARKAAEEEAVRKATEEEAARKKTEEEAARKAAEEEAARKKAEDEVARKAAEEETARKKAEDEAARKAAEEEAARKNAEDEAARKAAEEEAARKAAEEEATRKKAEEEAARKAAEKEAARKAAEEEAARKAAEKEAARKAAEREAARKAAEKEAARRAAEEEAARRKAREDAKKRAEEDAGKKKPGKGKCASLQARCAVEAGGRCNPETGRWDVNQNGAGGNYNAFTACLDRARRR